MKPHHDPHLLRRDVKGRQPGPQVVERLFVGLSQLGADLIINPLRLRPGSRLLTHHL